MTSVETAARSYRVLLERLPVRRIILVILSLVIAYGVIAGTVATLQTGRFTAEDWVDLFVAGVARGSVYAIIALGYTLVYGILFIINFAHGEVFMSGTFTAFFVAHALADQGLLNTYPVPALILLFVVSALVSMSIAVILERVAYRPLRGAPRLVPLITAIGASLFLQYTFRGFYGAQAKAYPNIDILQGNVPVAGFTIQRAQILVVAGAIILWLALYLVIERTRIGRAMRAVGEDREIAALMGIDVDRTIVSTFAIGGALAGAAGILFVQLFNSVFFFMGFFPGIKAFTAAVLGGIGSITGAALGGLVLGILEAVGPILFLTGIGVPSPNQLQPVVSFGILVLVLIFRPGGILGAPEEKRA
ncbi:MAG: branched-chain amino acid ABC transporter permease [Actinobacteria bacterium]|nr:branched-chain amino acid ABC transporter permease [Actinomycetota bacterium]MCI0544555.1 branched-chain amino acid ABC transporter permease [Actinomycetota bacterium]MCI0679369.1 branched-chain amino acid ABC transporter permease [Actinomycetota bacterium]